MKLNSPINRMSILAVATACSLLGCGGSNNGSNDSSDTPALTATLNASPEIIFAGDTSQLNWTSTGADRCTGHGFDVNSATNGTVNVAPTQTAVYTVTCTDSGVTNTARASTNVTVTSSASAPNLLQAAYQSTSTSYVFGFNSIPSIPIAGAPADTDFSRIAMLYDGSNYRLYALKANTDTELYAFIFDALNSRYRYQQADAAKITGAPADADPSSFAMSSDSASSQLYMRSQSQSSILHRFSRNPASGDFEYGFQTPSTVSVINTPLDSDFTRWAVLFDNNTERLYLGQSGNIDTLYPFAFNGNSGAFEYALNSAASLPITGTPANSDTSRFSMLHDGNDYRFYHPTADGTAPTDPTDIRPYMLSAYSCLQRQDANHFLFHGCFDWHSSVHAHWAVLRYGNLVERSSEVDDVVARLQSAALEQERMALNTATSFEMPYGRAWFLALALEYEELVGDTQMAPMAADIAASLRTFLSSRTINPLIREYGNHTWALIQLLRYYRARGQVDDVRWVEQQVDAHYLNYDSAAALSIDFSRPDFFSLWGNWATLLGLRDPALLQNWLGQQTIPDAALQPILDANSSHQLGMNPSRTWGLWWAASVSNDPRFDQAITAHQLEMAITHNERKDDYGAYGHWVPQFVIYANTQPIQ